MSDYDRMAKALKRIVEDGSCDCRPVTFQCAWCDAMNALPRETLEGMDHWDSDSQRKIAYWLLDPRCV
jgi:hypothetical protein